MPTPRTTHGSRSRGIRSKGSARALPAPTGASSSARGRRISASPTPTTSSIRCTSRRSSRSSTDTRRRSQRTRRSSGSTSQGARTRLAGRPSGASSPEGGSARLGQSARCRSRASTSAQGPGRGRPSFAPPRSTPSAAGERHPLDVRAPEPTCCFAFAASARCTSSRTRCTGIGDAPARAARTRRCWPPTTSR